MLASLKVSTPGFIIKKLTLESLTPLSGENLEI